MQQLALFDIDSAVVPSLKPGDWVKLRRKSTSAAYWKKGEIVQIESLHPLDGSARFWNERTESWGYLHPGDVISVPPPLDSVSVQPIARDTESNRPHSETDTIARVEADTESNCPHGEFDSVSKAPPADTESIPDPAEFDSVSIVPPADTESIPDPVCPDSISIVPPADTESNCPHGEFDSVSIVPPADTESNCPHNEFDFVSKAPPADTESIPDPVCLDSVSGPVATYRPKGTARGGEYFRFSYRAGGKMKHLHIPGGNTGSILAQSRATEVMELAAAGIPPLEICDRIKSWSKKNHLETE